MEIVPVGAELLHVDGQTNRQADMIKLVFVFRNFADGPQISYNFRRNSPWVSMHFTPALAASRLDFSWLGFAIRSRTDHAQCSMTHHANRYST